MPEKSNRTVKGEIREKSMSTLPLYSCSVFKQVKHLDSKVIKKAIFGCFHPLEVAKIKKISKCRFKLGTVSQHKWVEKTAGTPLQYNAKSQTS